MRICLRLEPNSVSPSRSNRRFHTGNRSIGIARRPRGRRGGITRCAGFAPGGRPPYDTLKRALGSDGYGACGGAFQAMFYRHEASASVGCGAAPVSSGTGQWTPPVVVVSRCLVPSPTLTPVISICLPSSSHPFRLLASPASPAPAVTSQSMRWHSLHRLPAASRGHGATSDNG